MKKSLILVLLCVFMFGQTFGQWQKAQLPASNAILSLAVDYSTSYVYAGSAGNGVYLSVDTGENWSTANTGLPANLNVWKILFQNKNIFLATNDGVYTSVNNGTSWQQSGLKGVLVNSFSCYTISDTTFLYAGTEKGIYLSKNNGIDWSLFAFTNQGVSTMHTDGVTFYAGMTTGGLNYYTDYRKIWAAADTGITTKTMVKSISVGGNPYLGYDGRPIIGTDHGVYFEKSTGNWVQEKDGSDTIVNSVLASADMGNQGYVPNQFSKLFVGTGKDPGNVYYPNQYPTGGYYWSALNTGIDGNVNALAMYRNIVFAGGSSLWVLKSDLKYFYFSYRGKLMQATGDTVTIKILSSEFWWITTHNDWLTLSPNQGTGDATVTVTAAPNNTNSIRLGYGWMYGGARDELWFYQAAANTTGIDNEVNSNITIYPVPVKDDLVISFPNQPYNTRFAISNLNGVELLASQLTGNTTKVNMSGFKPGVYVLKIISNNRVIAVQKIIKE